MIILTHRISDPLHAIRHQRMTEALEPLFEQMHEIVEQAGFRPFGELELSFPTESRDIDTRVNWMRKT